MSTYYVTTFKIEGLELLQINIIKCVFSLFANQPGWSSIRIQKRGFRECHASVITFGILQGFIQARPPKFKSTPKPGARLPPSTPHFWNVAEVYKMAKVLEDGRENW